MRRPTRQLVITFILGLIIGYGVSWAVMVWMGAQLRFYGVGALTLMALLVDLLIIFALDGPLNLKAFDWPSPDEESEGRDDNLKHFLAVGLLIIVVGGLVGAWLNSIELLPVGASLESIPIDNLMSLHFVVIGFLFALVMVFMGYSVIVFRRKPGDTEDGAFIHGNTPLEIVWTIVPLVIVIYFGYLGHMAFNEIRTLEPDAMVVEVNGYQWGWSFSYPEHGDITS